MITACIGVYIAGEKHKDALQTVRSILGLTRAQPGCISMMFYQDTNDPERMMLIEEWENWGNLENHIRSDSYRSILELMELSSKLPEIKFHSVSDTKGMEVIERLRG